MLYYNAMTFLKPGHDHSECTAELLARAEQVCGRRGARLTGQRRDVLNCVAKNHAAAGAYDIIERMAEQGPRPAPITVYRALEFLSSHGLVHKVESCNAFVACTRSHEGREAALLICESCGTVAELDAGSACAELERTARAQGFLPARAMIEISGRCAACAVC